VPALLDALDRVTAARRETERDARAAILDRVQALGAGGDTARAARLRPYLADYDTLVARRAAEVIGAWTGTRPTPAPRPLARAAVPTPDALDALARARVRLEMQGGGVVELALHPYDAPTSAARFATLVRDRVLDGLTFHRVVPGLLVQGGSPHANEYAGHGAYTREELALPNRRGSVGVSTRGRDTGDGQIYILTADWFELDHNFTILGTVVRGMDVVDRMHEGALIRRATLVTPGR
jgi:peptidyl-prolyl cis-trans isomerase B (cyclophilin B)